MVFLLDQMKRYFDKSLAAEAFKIKAMFVIYSLTYISRGVLFAVRSFT